MLIGVDIAEIARFENLSERFLNRCFTDEERQLFKAKTPAETAAAHFAAKEAFSKALGTGVRGFELCDISVLRKENGKPYFKFASTVSDILCRIGASGVELSISHDGGFAVAVVTIEQKEGAAPFSKAVEKSDTDDGSIISYKRVKSSIPKRLPNTHKGDYGKIFIVAGSKGLTGAAILSSQAALKSGGGLLTLGCCDSLNSIFETVLHEVMTYPMPDNDGVLSVDCIDGLIDRADKSSVLAFGCGLSNTKEIYEILKKTIAAVNVPVVIDADGINALAKNINILKTARSHVVLTPHIMEFSRISGLSFEEIIADKEKAASDFAVKWGVTVVLKSEQTVVADKDGNTYTNVLGNSGMATGGSGDVLTGIIASFIGQGIENAAQCGVYIHSLAADIAVEKTGEYGLTPTDIIKYIPCAINFICGKEDFIF